MLVSVYLCKNLNRKRAAAGSESAGDAVLPKEKCGASGKECGAKKRLLEKMPQGAGAFRRGCRGCRKTDALNREGRSLSCRRRKNAACQVKSAGKKRLPEKMPQGAGAFRRGCRGCRKTNAQGRRAPEAFLLTEKTGFAGVERFRVGTTPPRVFDYGQIH